VEIPKAEHDDVQSVKRSLQALLNIPRFRLRLVHGEMVLEDGASVASLVDVKLVVKAFTTDSQASASLITHSIQGRASEVESLLEEPQDPNLFGARGFTALMHASAQGHLEVMRLLLEAMAEPNLAASSGATALFDASHQGQDEAARLLLEARADVNAKSNNGVTALMNAIFHGKAESSHLRLLLEARADVNVKSNNGVTPLMNAAFRGNAESARLLLEARANMNEVLILRARQPLLDAAFGRSSGLGLPSRGISLRAVLLKQFKLTRRYMDSAQELKDLCFLFALVLLHANGYELRASWIPVNATGSLNQRRADVPRP
ncbi:unnamed protein product, partial [Symbiodinium sp. KB8]